MGERPRVKYYGRSFLISANLFALLLGSFDATVGYLKLEWQPGMEWFLAASWGISVLVFWGIFVIGGGALSLALYRVSARRRFAAVFALTALIGTGFGFAVLTGLDNRLLAEEILTPVWALVEVPFVVPLLLFTAWGTYRIAVSAPSPRLWLFRALEIGSAVCFIGVLIAAGYAGVRAQPQPEKGVTATTDGDGRHVLLLVVDTLRWDAVGANSDDAPATPHMDALASDSAVFANAYSASSWTLPGMASMLTGLTPMAHSADSLYDRLPRAVTTVAERLAEAGVRCGAFGINPMLLAETSGMAQGFETYTWYPRTGVEATSLGAKIYVRLFRRDLELEITDSELTDLTLEWFSENRGGNTFTWVHYFAPHLPYAPPDAFRPDGEAPIGYGFAFEDISRVRIGRLATTAEERDWIRALYEGEVRYADDEVGRLIAGLKTLELYDDMTILFTSDHGEEFWDHGGFEHGHTMYEELVKAPLFMKLPGASDNGRFDAVVSTMSVTPTILESFGVSTEDEGFHAPSLFPLTGSEEIAQRPLVLSGALYYEKQDAVLDGALKYILYRGSNRAELFDLRNDPRERHNIIDEHPGELEELRAELARARGEARHYRDARGISHETQQEMDAATVELLESVGYIR